MTFSVQRCHIFCVFPNIDVLQPSQDQNVISCQKASKSVSKWPRYLTKTAKNDVFRAAFPHFLRFPKYCCFGTFPRPKSNFLPKGVPVGFEMAEKNANLQTDISSFIWGATAPRPPQYKNRPVKQETTSRAVSTYKYNYFDNLEFGHILWWWILLLLL